MNQLMTKVFVEQPLAPPGSANQTLWQFSLGPTLRRGRVMVLMCVSVCLSVCLFSPPHQ